MATEHQGGLPIVRFATVPAFEGWLERHAGEAGGSGRSEGSGLWLKFAKAGSANTSISYAEALDAAICFGWIDGQKAPCDGGWWLQRFTPRRPRGRWSQINCGKAEALIEGGRMRPAGLAEVAAAKADGRWDAAYAGQRSAQVPADLQAALDQSSTAATFFATLSSGNRYAIIYRIESVKRAETRERKVAQYVAMLEAGQTIHP